MDRLYKNEVFDRAKIQKYVKGHNFFHLIENLVINTAIKTGIDAAKTASKRVVQKL